MAALGVDGRGVHRDRATNGDRCGCMGGKRRWTPHGRDGMGHVRGAHAPASTSSDAPGDVPAAPSACSASRPGAVTVPIPADHRRGARGASVVRRCTGRASAFDVQGGAPQRSFQRARSRVEPPTTVRSESDHFMDIRHRLAVPHRQPRLEHSVGRVGGLARNVSGVSGTS